MWGYIPRSSSRWPGKIAEGKRTDALVQYADVLPTLLAAAGSPANSQPEPSLAAAFDGTSFLSVLLGEKSAHRQYVYGMHNNVPEGPAYPIRTVSDGQYRYIRNLTPSEIYIEKHLMGIQGNGGLNNPYWATWISEASTDPRTYRLVKRYMHRPAEQLYHTSDDPYEMQDIANDPSSRGIKQRLAQELDLWMSEQGDPGIPEDTQQALQAARKDEHLYAPPDRHSRQPANAHFK